MAKIQFFYLLTVISCTRSLESKVSLLCTPEFCDEYVQKFPCPPLDPACSNPNISIVVPSPTVCNCCEHCFLFQDIGEDCVVGQLGQPLPKVICKPGTECVQGKCKKKTGPDPNFYPGYECKDGMCNCFTVDNNVAVQIFGSFKETPNIKKEKQCECSKFAYTARKVMNKFLPFPDLYLPIARCLPNGQYDPLQCIDNMCGCVNRTTGVWDLSIRKVPLGALGPNNPKCFDPMRHVPGEYHKQCERETNVYMTDKFWADFEDVDVMFTRKVQCTPDGEYAKTTTPK